jgi:predicted transcriptional regulator
MEEITKKTTMKEYEQKLMQLISDIEFLEDFIKVVAVDKIEIDIAKEILRLTKEAKERALK